MKTNATITLLIGFPDGKKYYRSIEAGDFGIFSEHLVDEFTSPIPMGFDSAVEMIKKREFRREQLMIATDQLATALADYLEDSEGWHGERRRETIKQQREFTRGMSDDWT